MKLIYALLDVRPTSSPSRPERRDARTTRSGDAPTSVASHPVAVRCGVPAPMAGALQSTDVS